MMVNILAVFIDPILYVPWSDVYSNPLLFIAVLGLQLVASGGYSLMWYVGFSL